jgi:RimJ/RimL family protein N-acetyltransferase
MNIGEVFGLTYSYTLAMSIILRNVTQFDLPIIFEQQRVPEANAMAAFPSRDQEAFNAHWAKIKTNDENIIKVIDYEGQLAGYLMSFMLNGEREVGYWLGKEYWGKGIATQALTEFLKLIETRPLYGHVAKHNIASRRVLEKSGFKVIGEDKYVNIGNEEVDEFVLRLDQS